MKKKMVDIWTDVFFSSVICFKGLLQHHVAYSISFNELTHERTEGDAYSSKKKSLIIGYPTEPVYYPR